MMHKVRVIASREFSLMLSSRTFCLGLLLPTAIAVGLLIYFGGTMRPAAARMPHGAAPAAGMGHAVPVFVGDLPAYLFVILMFVSIMMLSQYLLTSLIEEKSSRVVEVLLSAVSPFELMSGKILGLTAAGLEVGACAVVIGVVAMLEGFIGALNPWALALFLVYYVLGTLLISSMYAAVGSACNTLREAQGMMLPMAMLFIVPLGGWMYFVQHPNGMAATLLSFVPPLTPMVMILRLAASKEVPVWQIALSVLVLGASVPAMMWAAAKVFRTGMLMYGKPPKLREMVKWLRYK